jgi:hypothetical protein
MYRWSNHWGRLANSKWRLEPLEPESESKFGFCGLDQFYPDNALDALYYIEMNHIKTQSIISINPYYDGKAVRT